MAPREVSFRAFSSAYEYGMEQYPNQSNSRRDRDSTGSAASQPRTRTSVSNSRDRSRSKVNSVDTAIHIPSGEAINEFQSEDFQKRYDARRTGSHSESTAQQANSVYSPDSDDLPISPDFDGSGQPIASPASEPPKRGIHIPTRTRYESSPSQLAPRNQRNDISRTDSPTPSSSGNVRRIPLQPLPPPPVPAATQQRDMGPSTSSDSPPPSPEAVDNNAFDPGARSSGGSVFSQDTVATSTHTLPPLQTKGPDNSDAQYLEPVLEDDPRSWDLVAPPSDQDTGMYVLEKRAEQLLSAEHLRTIFDDPKLLLKFTGFLNSHRQQSIPILIYYLDALKALRAINYANAIAEALEPIKGQGFTAEVAKPTTNMSLEEKANQAFDALVREDLPAYVAHEWVKVVSVSIQRRITGTLAPHLREASEGLAEVFCLTDPSRTDNPIVFASEEFTRTTQYGMNYTIGRNCRFLQGPRTNPNSVRRLAIACSEGKEHTEVFVNYRRDGSPFMNLLMIAPLMDSRGNLRYHIGAQVDVSGLIKDCSEMEGLMRLVEKEQDPEAAENEARSKDEFQDLSEMFNGAELDTVRKSGGRMHKEYVDDSDRDSVYGGRPRLLLKDPSQDLLDREKKALPESTTSTIKERTNGKLEGIYQNYLLIRPAPSLRILFTSPSLRVPGILQSPFLNRIGGSSRVRSDLRAALAEGRGVTAKIRWLTRPDEEGEGEGRPRWIHCTPLLGHSGAVGVWMIVLVDDESPGSGNASGKRFRQAPPVSNNIGGKEWDASQSRERRQLNAYDKENDRRGGVYAGSVFSRPGSRNTNRVNSPAPGRSPGPRAEGSQYVTSANVSEFSFNLKG